MKITDCIFFYEGNSPVTVVPITKASNAERVFVSWCQNALRWRHNDHAGVSNHQPHGCLLNRLFRRRSKKTPKLRVTGLCAGNSPGPVNSPHKGPVTRKMFPFDDVIMGIHCFAFSHIKLDLRIKSVYRMKEVICAKSMLFQSFIFRNSMNSLRWRHMNAMAS